MKNAMRVAEILSLGLVLASVPIASVGLLLPVNEYAWMAAEGGAVPPDCDISTGFFLFPAGIVFALGAIGFGYLFLRRPSKLRLTGLVLSMAILAAIGLKTPEYLRESARAQELCSK